MFSQSNFNTELTDKQADAIVEDVEAENRRSDLTINFKMAD